MDLIDLFGADFWISLIRDQGLLSAILLYLVISLNRRMEKLDHRLCDVLNRLLSCVEKELDSEPKELIAW